VVLSHWHLDHIAGNAVFADCPIISCSQTVKHLERHKQAIEAGTQDGPPAISPLALPTETFDGRMTIMVGRVPVELIAFNIHSDDATVLWLAEERLLLAGDTLEDTVTYVAEPENLNAHLVDLERMAGLAPLRILPCHGDAGRIASGGYGPEFIPATAQYIQALLKMKSEPAMRSTPLRDLIAGPLASGALTYYAGYEAVHQGNVALVCKVT
jgi:cyclase